MLDLHGYTVNDAFKKFGDTVDHFYHAGYKKLTIVTGHGEIANEIKVWADNNVHIREIKRQDPNKGSYLCFLKKKKQLPGIAGTQKVDLSPLLKKFNSHRQ